jgi:type II restriction enzyme
MSNVIGHQAIARRKYWIGEIQKLSGNFVDDFTKLERELKDEFSKSGVSSIIDHLRLCGDIPEQYDHDSSEEKLYSKYTDALLSHAFASTGLKSLILTERGDSADVEAFGKNYSLVADAKAFRLSRTAKNQKDFKVAAMDKWKRGKPYAVVVCPIYQLPVRSSQIYEQATSHDVCIFTYSHLSVLVAFAAAGGNSDSLLHGILKSVTAINPSKDAIAYWTSVNRAMLSFDKKIADLWKVEKQAAIESVAAAKELALAYLAGEREKIMRMSHDEAIRELIKINRIESRIATIKAVDNNGIMDI